jgi:hypothetical protein
MITERQLVLWPRQSHRKPPKLCAPLSQIERISLGRWSLSLTSSSHQLELNLPPSEFMGFVAALSDVLGHLLTEDELDRLDFLSAIPSVRSSFGCFCRFLDGVENPDPDQVRVVRNLLMFERRSFSMREFGDSLEIKDGFFKMLALCPSLEALQLSYFDYASEIVFGLAHEFASRLSHVKFLRVDAIASHFGAFLRFLKRICGYQNWISSGNMFWNRNWRLWNSERYQYIGTRLENSQLDF